MMKKLTEQSGLTLTELIVASIMIAIVMIGVAAFSNNIKGIQDSTGRSTLLEMRTAATMAKIRADAEAAIGDALNPGISFEKAVDKGRLCFRYEGGDPATPDDYGDDRWTCYTHGNSYHIYRCENLTNPVIPHCVSNGQGQPYAGFTEIPDNGDVSFFSVVPETMDPLEYIEINLIHRYNKDAACHPIHNPCHTLTTRISPPSHSR